MCIIVETKYIVMDVIEQIRVDQEIYYSWQACIAMSIYNAYVESYMAKKAKNKTKATNLTRLEVHNACNEGAKRFLDLLIKQA